MKVAITQMKMSSKMEENIQKAESLIRGAAKEGAKLILLPELFYLPYFCKEEDYACFQLARSKEESPILAHFAKLAGELHVILPISFFEKANNQYFNSLVVYDIDGKELTHYRKSHIPTGAGYEEKFYFAPGNTGFKVSKAHGVNVGAAICWDQWFPETARALALKGAEVFCFPTAIGSEPVTGKDSRAHWRNVMLGHAAANLTPVLASNRIGEEKQGNTSVTFFGNSFIGDQHGEILILMDDKEEGYRVIDLDLSAIEKERTTWGVFRDRRPELYTAISDYKEE